MSATSRSRLVRELEQFHQCSKVLDWSDWWANNPKSSYGTSAERVRTVRLRHLKNSSAQAGDVAVRVPGFLGVSAFKVRLKISSGVPPALILRSRPRS